MREHGYGIGDNSYRAAGELEGLTNLVEEFYRNMQELPKVAIVRAMYPLDLSVSKKKLLYFLSGWLGGPKLYAENFGGINIPSFHKSFPIEGKGRDAWMLCMETAIREQPYAEEFKEYLVAQFWVPARRIEQVNDQR